MAAVVSVESLIASTSDDGDCLATRLFELANLEAVSFVASSGRTLVVRQDPAIPHTGGCVWETAYLMALWAHAELEPRAKLAAQRGEPLRVLEVGAGCGFVGLALAHMGCRVLLTEQPGVLANLEENVRRNNPRALGLRGGECGAARLRWGDAEDLAALRGETFDLIIGTDVVYCPELVSPLLRTLWACCDSERTSVLLCLQQRCVASHALLLTRAPDFFGAVEHVPLGEAPCALVRAFAAELDCELLRFGKRRPGGDARGGSAGM